MGLCSTLVLACNSALDQTREMEVPDLLQAVVDKDLKDVPQCKQDGVTKCTAVSTDMGLIRSLKSGDKIGLLQGLDISMELRRDPEVTSSGGLSLPLLLGDGGEANVVAAPQAPFMGPSSLSQETPSTPLNLVDRTAMCCWRGAATILTSSLTRDGSTAPSWHAGAILQRFVKKLQHKNHHIYFNR